MMLYHTEEDIRKSVNGEGERESEMHWGWGLGWELLLFYFVGFDPFLPLSDSTMGSLLLNCVSPSSLYKVGHVIDEREAS